MNTHRTQPRTARTAALGSLSLEAGGYFAVPPLRPATPRHSRAPKMPAFFLSVFIAGIVLFCHGCTSVGSTARRAGAVAAGSAVGGLAGHAAGDGDAALTGAGAVAGGLLTHLALGRDPDVLQEGFDRGYVRGQSDAIKRHYFLRQSLESRPLPDEGGRTVTYVLPGPAATPEGIRLAPHLVATPVKE